MLTPQLNKDAHPGSIQGGTGNRERPVESMDGKEAWRKERQRVKLLWNIHHTQKTAHQGKEVTPSVACSMSQDRKYILVEHRRRLVHYIVLKFLGCQHAGGSKCHSCGLIGIWSHRWEPGSRKGGTAKRGRVRGVRGRGGGGAEMVGVGGAPGTTKLLGEA